MLQVENREYAPRFFCGKGLARLHAQLVSAALGKVSPGGKWHFFMTKKGSLGGVTPLAALSQGRRRAGQFDARPLDTQSVKSAAGTWS